MHAPPFLPGSHAVVNTADNNSLQIVALLIDATASTVQLQGELDFGNARLVSAALVGEIALGRRFVRLDLSRLTFIDCAGLGMLVQAHQQLLAVRGTLALTGAGPRIVKLLNITGLDHVLFVVNAEETPNVRHLRSSPKAPTR